MNEEDGTLGGPHRVAVRLISSVAEDAADVFVLIDRAGAALLINDGRPLASLIEGPTSRVVDDPWAFIAPDDHQRVKDAYAAVVAAPGAIERVRLSAVANGVAVPLRATLTNLLDDPNVAAVVVRLGLLAARVPGSLDDIVEESWPGGRLPNKEAFLKHLKKVVVLKDQKIWQLERVARTVVRDRRYDYSLLLLELDRFKMLLGGLGRDILEELVAQVIQRISAMLRGKDVVAHFGAGEFGILLHRVGMTEHATTVADAVLEQIKRRFEVSGQPISVVPVIGIASSERHYRTADEVVRDATAAASRAFRRRGRRREAFKTRMRIEDTRRISLMADMHEAIGSDAFSVVYQPIVRLDDEELVGFEALLRWRHPERGQISPEVFIPLAEECGLIRPLGRWVLQRACNDMAIWNAALTSAQQLKMSVNVSPLQFGDDQLVRDVEAVLDDTKLPPEQLRLEITESAVLDNLDNVTEVIGRLKKLGVTFSLDDFGTGYASLSYLRLLPYDALKLDRVFLRGGGAHNDEGDMAIVRAVIGMSQGLGLAVIAEGVETAEQAKMLRELGCEFAQGYHFSRPLKLRQAAELIMNGRRW